MSQLEQIRTYTVLPYYLVVDVSESMHRTASTGRPVIDEVESWCAGLLMLFNSDAVAKAHVMAATGMDNALYKLAKDCLQISVIEFSTRATRTVALSTPAGRDWAGLNRSGGLTDYRAAFTEVHRAIAEDIGNRGSATWYRPAVIFLTDGVPQDADGIQPTERWVPAYRKLGTLSDKSTGAQTAAGFVPAVVAIGWGNAAEGVLEQIGSRRHGGRTFQWQGSEVTYRMIGTLMKGIMDSIRDSVRSDDFKYPDEMEGFTRLRALGEFHGQ